jgi:hypothetical protein
VSNGKQLIGLRPMDTRSVFVSGLLATACLIPFAPFNHLLTQAIPTPVAGLMLLIPFFIYFGISSMQRGKYADYLVQQARAREENMKGAVALACRYKATSSQGTAWEFVNENPYPWTKVTLLIERDIDGFKSNERHHLPAINPRQKVTIESDLKTTTTAQWRIMMISDQGRVIDFPDPWPNRGQLRDGT